MLILSIYSVRKNAHNGALPIPDGVDVWPPPADESSPEESSADTVDIGGDRCGSAWIGVDLGRIALDVTSKVVFKWPTGASGVNFSLTDAPDATGRDE